MDVLLATHAQTPYADQDDGVLLDALRRRGVEAAASWWADREVDWADAGMVVIRSTWDYFGRRDEFVAWAERVGSETRLENNAEVIAWNTHKGYLAQLEERGTPIVPTAFVGQGDRADLAQLLSEREWPDAIIKPAIAGAAQGLHRVRATQEGQANLDGLMLDGDVLVQPFVPSVADGELSVVFLGREFSHGVRKVPAPGELRVQVEFGGVYSQVDPPPEALELARWVLEAAGHSLLYARVDLLADDDGSWMLAELEVTEPSLYLDLVPAGADRLADLIVTTLKA